MAEASPYAQGIFNAVKGSLGLFKDYNKVEDVKANGLGGSGSAEEPRDEYQSTYSKEQAQAFRKEWNARYSAYFAKVEPLQKIAFDYWLGNQKRDPLETIDGHDTVDNLIFEATETFLPIANKANPDPIVSAGDTPEGIQLAKNVKNVLVDWADTQDLRMKLKGGTRNWTLNQLGIWKVSWNVFTKEIDCEVRPTNKLKLDPDGHWDESGLFTGDWIGDPKKMSAGTLSDMFPDFKEKIKTLSKGNMSRKLTLEEWWYKGTDIFYYIEEECVGTFKNPNWNYDGEDVTTDPITQEEIKTPILGKNHKFGRCAPQFPYVGLSVFSTREQPHDDTSLILQNVPLQDLHNKRLRQIDKNADSQNNGALASGSSFTKEQAAEAATFLRKGGTVWVPNGDVNAAWKRDAAPALPGDIYQQQKESEARLQNIFGTAGSSAQGIQQEQSVRGKIMVQQSDSSRIGGGVTEYIEKCADTIYNFVVQFMYVYYDEDHFVSAMGQEGAVETISIRNSDFTTDVKVTVKDGSLIPKDPLTERNEAMDLWEGNAIGLPELYLRLDFPDPMASAKQTLLWQQIAQGRLPPQLLFPDFPSPQVQAPVGVGGPVIDENTSVQPPVDPATQQGNDLLKSVPIG